MSRAVDVGATVEAGSLVEIKLPRLRVVVEQRQAERLRDVLNTVLPKPVDPLHDPRVSDLDTLKAAMSIAHDAGYLSAAARIETVVDALVRSGKGDAGEQPRVARTLRLLHVWGDVDPELSGPYETEQDRLEAAQDYRRAHGEENGVFKLDVTGDVEADVLVESYTGGDLEMPKRRARGCTLCRCTATGEAYGLPVCDYHADHSEDEPRCPDCVPVHTGDRVFDGDEWRTVTRLDLAENVAYFTDGGCMSIDEAGTCEKRLPSEALPS